jgi:hypothetical protein
MKTVWKTKLTDVSTTDKEGIGRIRIEDDKIYRYVKYEDDTNDLEAGDVVCHDLDEGQDFLKSVVVPSNSDIAAMAGVVLATVDASESADYYFWIQVGGVAEAYITHESGTTAAAGSFVKAVNSQLYASKDSTQPTYPNCLQLIDALETKATPASAKLTCVVKCYSV